MHTSWSHRTVFVTGGSGLVGSFLVKKLLELRATVVLLVRDLNPQTELYRSRDFEQTITVQGSLEDYHSIERAINDYEVDTVFHLGAQTLVGVAHRSPLPTFEANIRGSYHLLEACRRLSPLVQRIVVASSDKAYGTSPVLPYTETMPLQGRHPYDVSKTCTDLLALTYAHTYNLPIAIARCGNIYGGGDLNWSRLIPGTIRSFLNNERPSLRSNGQLTRDYLYVKDVVLAYMTLAEQLHRPEVQGEPFNFGPNHPRSALDIVERLQSLMGCTSLTPHILDRIEGEIQDQSLDSTKARKLLGWDLSYSLDEGLAETIAWYQAYLATGSCEHP